MSAASTPSIVQAAWLRNSTFYTDPTNWDVGVAPNNTAKVAYEVGLGTGASSGADDLFSAQNETVAMLTVAAPVTFVIASSRFGVDSAALGLSELDDSGLIHVSIGATLAMGSANDPSTLAAKIVDQGSFELAGGLVSLAPTLYIDSSKGAFYMQGGVITGGTHNVLSDVTLAAGVIQGYGAIVGANLALNVGSAGVIDATSFIGLSLNTAATIENLGTIESTGSGALFVTSDIDNQGSLADYGTGRFVVSGDVFGGAVYVGAGATFSLLGGLHGPSVKIDPGARLVAAGAAASIDTGTVSDNGAIVVAAGATLSLRAAVAGSGAMTLGDGAQLNIAPDDASSTQLDLDGGLRLNGFAFIEATAAAATLDNKSTISGGGEIGDGNLDLINDAAGVIDANVAGGALVVTAAAGAPLSNAGLMEAVNHASLFLDGGEIDNTGEIAAASGGAVVLAGALLPGTGGSISVAASSSLTLGPGSAIKGDSLVRIDAGGSVAVDGDDALETALTNNGQITFVGTGQRFSVGGAWTGTGVVRFGANDIVSIEASDGAWILLGGQSVSFDDDLVVSAADNSALQVMNGTLSGSGVISDALASSTVSGGTLGGGSGKSPDAQLSIVVGSRGVIEAEGVDGSSSGVASPSSLLLAGADLVNQGALIAANAATLTVASVLYNSGTVTALSGGTVDLKDDVFYTGGYYIAGTEAIGGAGVAGGVLELGASAHGATHFAGVSGTLILDHSAQYTGVISGLAPTDAIDLRDVAYDGANTFISALSVYTPSYSMIYLQSDGHLSAPLRLQGNFDAAASSSALGFDLIDDGAPLGTTGRDGTELLVYALSGVGIPR